MERLQRMTFPTLETLEGYQALLGARSCVMLRCDDVSDEWARILIAPGDVPQPACGNRAQIRRGSLRPLGRYLCLLRRTIRPGKLGRALWRVSDPGPARSRFAA